MPRQPRLGPRSSASRHAAGNRREPVFFCDEDYAAYLRLLREWAGRAGTDIWAYCLMPNHVHLILVPSREDGLRATLGEAHRRYTRMVNFREGWRGYLWQERFHSFVMDETWLVHCVRYVALNPVAAGMVARPEDWRWSSTRAHAGGQMTVSCGWRRCLSAWGTGLPSWKVAWRRPWPNVWKNIWGQAVRWAASSGSPPWRPGWASAWTP